MPSAPAISTATAAPTSCGRTQRRGRDLGDERHEPDWQRAVSAIPGPSWHAIGTGDFNGDGLSDILLQNSSGEVVSLGDERHEPDRRQRSLGNPGPTWHAIGTGDFNGDGRSDILWQNDNGEVVIWELNGDRRDRRRASAIRGRAGTRSAPATINGDGHSDILFQNPSGEVAHLGIERHRHGRQRQSRQSRAELASAGRQQPLSCRQRRSAVADRRHRRSFLQNDSGEAFVWATNGAAVTGGGSLGNPGPSWHVKAAGDFNSDGNPDLLWQNDNGEAAIWETEWGQP